MKTIDIYKQYFEGECEIAGVIRHGVSVVVTSESENGNIRYTLSVNFFPHVDEEDYGITYDAINTAIICEGKGRRSKKREEEFLKQIQEKADMLAKEMNGSIMWENPLSEATLG